MSEDRLDEFIHEAKGARKLAQTAIQEKTALAETVDDLRNEVSELRSENERLSYRIAELEAIKPDRSTPYEELSREDRVGRVREELMMRADASATGCADLDYKDVMWSVFSGEPSVGYVYELMRHAAKSDGFSVNTPPTGNKRVTVDLGAVKEVSGLSHVNKDIKEGSS